MFFAPPQVIQTEMFARLPDALNRADPDNEWVLGQPVGMPAKSLLEGPSFDRDGNLWCVDVVNGRVFRVAPDGVFAVVAEYDGWPNGLKIHRDGRIFIADYKHGIMLLDPVNGRVTPYLVRAGLERFKARERPVLRAERRPVFHRPGHDRPARPDRAAVPRPRRRQGADACWTMCRARTGW